MQKGSTNKTVYVILGIVILLIVFLGVGYKVVHHYTKTMAVTSPAANTPTTAPSVMPTSAAGLSNKSDTSNQQLNQDAQSIQNSMNQLNQDQVTAGQAVNNQSADTPQ